jgi:hypothetical protein
VKLTPNFQKLNEPLIRKTWKVESGVSEKLELYSKATSRVATTLLADTALEAQRQEIREWIWPKSKSYIPPKTGKLVDEGYRLFLASYEYAAWVGMASQH